MIREGTARRIPQVATDEFGAPHGIEAVIFDGEIGVARIAGLAGSRQMSAGRADFTPPPSVAAPGGDLPAEIRESSDRRQEIQKQYAELSDRSYSADRG